MSSSSSSSRTTPTTTFVASSDVSSVVSSSLAGLASFGPHQLHHRLEKNVVVSTPLKKEDGRLLQRRKQRVAVVSGGGSGHEPAMSGFTGPGFLSAAACGDVFASPSVDQIGTAIDAVLEEDEDIDSIALVVMNYTGGTNEEDHFFFFFINNTSRIGTILRPSVGALESRLRRFCTSRPFFVSRSSDARRRSTPRRERRTRPTPLTVFCIV